jgi:hypothetical protein
LKRRRGFCPQTEREEVSKQKPTPKDTPAVMSERRETRQQQCQKEETPNDVSELGVVVVDLREDEVFGSSTQ